MAEMDSPPLSTVIRILWIFSVLPNGHFQQGFNFKYTRILPDCLVPCSHSHMDWVNKLVLQYQDVTVAGGDIDFWRYPKPFRSVARALHISSLMSRAYHAIVQRFAMLLAEWNIRRIFTASLTVTTQGSPTAKRPQHGTFCGEPKGIPANITMYLD
jgi:hypothetical protein